MCYHAEFGRSALRGVSVNAEPQKLWRARTLLSWMGGVADWLTPRYTPFSTCVTHIKFGSSVTKDVHINGKEAQKMESAWAPLPWVGGMADPLKQAPSLYV